VDVFHLRTSCPTSQRQSGRNRRYLGGSRRVSNGWLSFRFLPIWLHVPFGGFTRVAVYAPGPEYRGARVTSTSLIPSVSSETCLPLSGIATTPE